MKRRTKIISAVMALAILVCVFAVLATSFAVDTSSESASFRVDAQIMGYDRVEVKIYAPAGAAGGSYTLKYDSSYLRLVKPDADKNGEQTSVASYENGGTAITNYNFSQDSLRCSAAAPKSSSTEQLYGSYTFKFDGNYKEGSISVTAFDIYSGDETPKLLGSDKTAKCDFDVKAAPANTISLKYIGDKYYYMVSGKNDTSYSGLVNYYGTYYYVENGVLNWDYSGLTKYYDTWYYVENSVLNWNYTGLTKYYGTWYYVENSVLNWNYTGLTKYYGTWYYVENSVLNWNYTGLTSYYGTWYYVENSVLNWNYTGLTNYYGTWYYCEGSVLNWDYTGLTKYYGTWYYVKKGVLDWNYTGYTYYYGTYYGVVNGVLDWNFSGVLRYGTTLYYVRNGVLDWNYKGKAMYCTGKTYTFRNGAAIDYDGYVADAAQALALIKYYEAKEGNTVTLVEAEGMPDDVYNGVAVTVKIRSNDGSEEYYTAITFKNFQQYTNLTGIMENEGDGYLYVIIVAGNHNEDNSVVLSNDAILAYLDGMDSFALLNPISV